MAACIFWYKNWEAKCWLIFVAPYFLGENGEETSYVPHPKWIGRKTPVSKGSKYKMTIFLKKEKEKTQEKKSSAVTRAIEGNPRLKCYEPFGAFLHRRCPRWDQWAGKRGIGWWKSSHPSGGNGRVLGLIGESLPAIQLLTNGEGVIFQFFGASHLFHKNTSHWINENPVSHYTPQGWLWGMGRIWYSLPFLI